MDATSKKDLEVMVSPSIKQSPVSSMSGANCKMKMVDACNATWKDGEGLEMFNSTCPRVVQKDSARSWHTTSLAFDYFLKVWVITWYALQSLSLSNMDVEELQGNTTNPLLPTFSKERLLSIGCSLQ